MATSGWMQGEMLSVREQPACMSAKRLLFADGVKRGLAAAWLYLGCIYVVHCVGMIPTWPVRAVMLSSRTHRGYEANMPCARGH